MSRKTMSSRLSVVTLMMVMVVETWEARIADTQTANSSACKQERRMLVNACRSMATGAAQSPYCCQHLRATRVECVCPIITPVLAALIDVNHAVSVIQGCGRPVPRHYKCGSMILSTPVLAALIDVNHAVSVIQGCTSVEVSQLHKWYKRKHGS